MRFVDIAFFDHICVAPSRTAAMAALPHLVANNQWAHATVWENNGFGLQFITAEAQIDYSDPEVPQIVAPRQALPGFWFCVTRRNVDPLIRGAPVCRIIQQRSKDGQTAICYRAPDLDQDALASVIRVVPAIAGAQFPKLVRE